MVECTEVTGALRGERKFLAACQPDRPEILKCQRFLGTIKAKSQSVKPIHIGTSVPPLDGVDGMKLGLMFNSL